MAEFNPAYYLSNMPIIQLARFVILFKIRTAGRQLSDKPYLRLLFSLLFFLIFFLVSRSLLLREYHVLYLFISPALGVGLTANYKKVEFYKQQFSYGVCYLILFSEILLTMLPSMAMILLFSHGYNCFFQILFCAIYPAFNNKKFSFSIGTIPSIYSKESYEFNYGYRTLVFLYLFFVSLLAIAAGVKNSNLFLASAISIVIATAVLQNRKFVGEIEFFRMYKRSPKEIIISKCKQGIINMLLLTTPILIISLLDVSSLLLSSLLTISLGMLYYVYSILLRFVLIRFMYSQHEILNFIAHIALLALLTAVPFFFGLLLLIIPSMLFFYRQAIKKLSLYLND